VLQNSNVRALFLDAESSLLYLGFVITSWRAMLKRCWRSFSPRWRTTYRERPSSKILLNEIMQFKTPCLTEPEMFDWPPKSNHSMKFIDSIWKDETNVQTPCESILTHLGLGLLSRNLTTHFGSQAISIFFNMERGHGSTQNACECTFLQFRVCGVLSRKSSKHIQGSPP